MELGRTAWACLTVVAVSLSSLSQAEARDLPVVPGTGTFIDWVGDTFEDSEWDFIHNLPKSSRETDEQTRFPRGYSTNGRWFEGPERGHPDVLKVVPSPPGALPGSQSSLLVRTRDSGVPGRHGRKVEQDDLIVDCVARLGGTIPVREIPSAVVRVYLPPADQWENRTGPHFGFRCTTNCIVTKTEEQEGRFRFRPRTYEARDPYWPGIWIHFQSETDPNVPEDSAFLAVRGNTMGHDFKALEIPQEKFGWWTMGLSVTATGMIHYYASPGVDDLTEDDYLTSQYPYSRQAERFETMFFNYCNRNDGKTWSTPFLIDDPRLYVVHSNRVMAIVNSKKQFVARQEAATKQAALMEGERAEDATSAAAARSPRTARSGGQTKPAPDPTFRLNDLYR